jgi:hypothetical protein
LSYEPPLDGLRFLIGCSTTLALGQKRHHPAHVEKWMIEEETRRGKELRLSELGLDEAWLSKNSKGLLDIIEILYKGRDAEIKELEAAQKTMKSGDQIERRIALIKATLLEKGAKAEPSESPGAPATGPPPKPKR